MSLGKLVNPRCELNPNRRHVAVSALGCRPQASVDPNRVLHRDLRDHAEAED